MSFQKLFLCLFIALPPAAMLSASGPANIHWKPFPGALLKLGGYQVKSWNLYQGDKKGKLFLLKLGHRILILDLQEHQIYEAPPTDFPAVARDEEFQGRAPSATDRRVPTIDWTLRDVGPAELVRVTLNDYGQTLELQIPHPPDYRGGRY